MYVCMFIYAIKGNGNVLLLFQIIYYGLYPTIGIFPHQILLFQVPPDNLHKLEVYVSPGHIIIRVYAVAEEHF